MTTNTLRHYQLSHINRILRQVATHNEAALISCVGSGKTLTASVVGSEAMNRGIVNRVICATPFTTIAEEFKRYTGSHWASNAQNNSQFTIRPIVEDEGVKHVADVVKCSDEFLVTTHAAVASKLVVDAVKWSKDLTGLLLVIDEAHHCFASEDEREERYSTQLGRLARMITAKGGKVLYITATPYRIKNKSTYLIFNTDTCKPVVRTIGEQMRDNLAPALRVEYVHNHTPKERFSLDKHTVFGDLTNSRINAKQLKVVLPQIMEKWRADGYPKAILLIPQGDSRKTAQAVKSYIEREILFPKDTTKVRRRRHPKVLVSLDKANSSKGEKSELMLDREEHGQRYDMIIGCRKFDEGTDSPASSHMYMIGLPSNVRLFHQRSGRLLRDRRSLPGYQEWFGDQWVAESRIVFFAPVGGKSSDFGHKVGRQLWHCIIAGESYKEYCNAFQDARDALGALISSARGQRLTILEQVQDVFSGLEVAYQGDRSSREYDVRSSLALNPGETVGDKLQRIKSTANSDAERLQGYKDLLDHLPPSVRSGVRVTDLVKRIERRITLKNKELDFGSSIREAADEFEELIQRFNNDHLEVLAGDEVDRVGCLITGQTFAKWQEEFQERIAVEERLDRVLQSLKRKGIAEPTKALCLEEYNYLMHLRHEYLLNPTMFPEAVLDVYRKWESLDLLTTSAMERRALKAIREICEFISDEKKVPSRTSDAPEERRLGGRLAALRTTRKRGSGKKSNRWYPSYDALAKELKNPGLLKTKCPHEEFEKGFASVERYLKKHKELPPYTSPEYLWITKSKRLKILNNPILKPEHIRRAAALGYPDLFTSKRASK